MASTKMIRLMTRGEIISMASGSLLWKESFATLYNTAGIHNVVVRRDMQLVRLILEHQAQELLNIACIQGRRIRRHTGREVGLAHQGHAMFFHNLISFGQGAVTATCRS